MIGVPHVASPAFHRLALRPSWLRCCPIHQVWGIYKADAAMHMANGFLGYAWCEILLLCSLVWHRSKLKLKGLVPSASRLAPRAF